MVVFIIYIYIYIHTHLYNNITTTTTNNNHNSNHHDNDNNDTTTTTTTTNTNTNTNNSTNNRNHHRRRRARGRSVRRREREPGADERPEPRSDGLSNSSKLTKHTKPHIQITMLFCVIILKQKKMSVIAENTVYSTRIWLRSMRSLTAMPVMHRWCLLRVASLDMAAHKSRAR